MVGPVIYTFGNDEQKERFLPAIRSVDGVVVPGLLRARRRLRPRRRCGPRRVRDGDHYVVNGQKIWTTLAQWADWIFCLVRTSTRRPSRRRASPSC